MTNVFIYLHPTNLFIKFTSTKVIALFKLNTLLLVSFINLCVYAQQTPTYVVTIPLRDGKLLAAEIYVSTAGTSCPTVLLFIFHQYCPKRF